MDNNIKEIPDYDVCQLVDIYGKAWYFACEIYSNKVVTIGFGCNTWEQANEILQSFLDD